MFAEARLADQLSPVPVDPPYGGSAFASTACASFSLLRT